MVDMSRVEYEPRRRRKGGGRKVAIEPRSPEKVFKIVLLRELRNLSWAEVALKMGESRQGPYLLYKRWGDWTKEFYKCQW